MSRYIYVQQDVIEKLKIHISELKGVNQRVYFNKCRFILSRILWKKITQSKDYNANGAKLRTHANSIALKEHPEYKVGTLAWYFGGPVKQVSDMMYTLEQWGLIRKYNDAIKGVTCRTYKLGEAYEDSPISQHLITNKDGAFVKRYLNLQQERNKAPLVRAVLDTYENHISISEDGLLYLETKYHQYPVIQQLAEAWRKGLVFDQTETLRHDIADVRIEPIDTGLMLLFQRQFYASISNKNGRLDHNLTSLKKCFRKYILIDGRPMVETDISNCQPTFAIPLLFKKLRELHGDDTYAPADMVHYENCCRSGLFYEAIAERVGMDIRATIDRNHFKRQVYKEVVYCKNSNWNTPIKKAFIDLFPNAYRAIVEIKKGNHRTYAIQLQRLESDLIVQYVYKQLISEGHKALTIHDAVYCTSEDVKQRAQQLIRQAFIDKHNLTIRFKDDAKGAALNSVTDSSRSQNGLD